MPSALRSSRRPPGSGLPAASTVTVCRPCSPAILVSTSATSSTRTSPEPDHPLPAGPCTHTRSGTNELPSTAYEPVRASHKRSTPSRLSRPGAAEQKNDGLPLNRPRRWESPDSWKKAAGDGNLTRMTSLGSCTVWARYVA